MDAEDYNVLLYLIDKKVVSFDQVMSWAYAQYSDDGIDPFIEEISFALTIGDVRDLIKDNFSVGGEPKDDFLSGEAVKNFVKGVLNIDQ
ncbi:hypothetical protein [Pleionea sp. CnH1-48]|uniref:hypothetical protein n=1 Tax=Pleionea sp. CnH1-48 TaxID=2954494 RepID=UPI002097C414|nr:hypothetical protein [Pleionea sp. CnH1-48]MCO7222734.1 hypothetical protein [Pleionea sp. CnH1-48]